MDETKLRSRQKVASKTSDKTSDKEKEEMPLKNRKEVTANYEFGDEQKIPTNVQVIMEKKFLRIFIWELYFGEYSFDYDWFLQIYVVLLHRIYFLVNLFWDRSNGYVFSYGEISNSWL